MRQTFLIEIDRRSFVAGLLASVGVLAFLFVISSMLGEEKVWQFCRLFNLDGEANVAAWFSRFLLALASAAAYACASFSSVRKEKNMWRMTAFGLLFLSCDETAGFHETAGSILSRFVSAGFLPAAFNLGWPVLIGPIFAIVFVWLVLNFRQCLHGTAKSRRYLILGSVFLFGAALGLEVLHSVFQIYRGFLFKMEVFLEEGFEMLGSISILYGLLLHAEHLYVVQQVDRTVECAGRAASWKR
ncbi:MAG: hypothetical protein NC910_03425 [Candidatus Omnitrophica bacterium]|nr:hypothetical protein [Candidatus Omnitrophota bacterium]